MKLAFCFALATIVPAVMGAETNSVPRPRTSQAPVVSPEVHPAAVANREGRIVTFRVRAPNATNVTIFGEWSGGSKAMKKDEAGVWSINIGPLDPDLYGYSFSIDGFQTLDPANPAVKPMRSPRTSILEIPGNPPRLHEFDPAVPHGTVRQHLYHSKGLNRRRGLYVYTPPGYDQTRDTFPVLYLFHGAGDNEATWTALGRAHLILDNLIAQKKAKPMIIVMTDGHASVGQPSTNAAVRARNTRAFENDLLDNVIPFVEANYRTINNPENRAIIGLSMGGGQSLAIGLEHPGLFAWVGGMSSAPPDADGIGRALEDPEATNRKLKLLWIAIGKDDFLLRRNEQLNELLMSKGIQHTFKITEGNHSWPVWRKYLAEFAPLLFTEIKDHARQ